MTDAVLLPSLNPTSYGIYRSLRDAGCPCAVHVFHQGKVGGGLVSLLGQDTTIHAHSIIDDPIMVLDCMNDIRRQSDGAVVLFTASDQDNVFLQTFGEQLDTAILVPHRNPAIYSLINDKAVFASKLDEQGIPNPQTRCYEASTVHEVASQLSWPRLIKPNCANEWKTSQAATALAGKKAIVVNSSREFLDVSQSLLGFSSQLLAQQIIDVPDDGSFSFCGYSDAAGRLLWGFVTRKLLQYPAKFGTAILCATTECQEIYALGKRVAEGLGVVGVFEIEIVVDRTGAPFVIEMNARHWLQHRLSNCLGINISLLDFLYRKGDLRWRNALADGSYRTGKASLWIDESGYWVHLLKNVFRPASLYLQEYLSHNREFLYLDEQNVWPSIRFSLAKVFA